MVLMSTKVRTPETKAAKAVNVSGLKNESRSWYPNSAPFEYSDSWNLLHVSTDLYDESGPILFRVHCELHSDVRYFRTQRRPEWVK